MQNNITLAYSPCPNDVFVFAGLAQKKIDTQLNFDITLSDVQTLNEFANSARFDVTKISAFAYRNIKYKYQVLSSGCVLGYGCGPLLLSRPEIEWKPGHPFPDYFTVAIPGLHTTSHLLLRLFLGNKARIIPMNFAHIMPSVAAGLVDFGVVIHEGRFIYSDYGLQVIQDLGEFWHRTYNLPLPLGLIVAHKDIPLDIFQNIEKAVYDSILYSHSHKEEIMPYIRKYSPKLVEHVIQAHIRLYVNDETLSLSSEGRKAIDFLLQKADEILPIC